MRGRRILSSPFIYPIPFLFNPEKFSLSRARERESSFLRWLATKKGEGGKGDDNRRSRACGSCDGPRHVAHVQVQRELEEKKKKKREGISGLETGERAQPVGGEG